eukprot:m.128855 g.128855  ORF g.128855 m.128855 type:complete len:92 (+) comp17449_c1_seq1:504-779(+)
MVFRCDDPIGQNSKIAGMSATVPVNTMGMYSVNRRLGALYIWIRKSTKLILACINTPTQKICRTRQKKQGLVNDMKLHQICIFQPDNDKLS